MPTLTCQAAKDANFDVRARMPNYQRADRVTDHLLTCGQGNGPFTDVRAVKQGYRRAGSEARLSTCGRVNTLCRAAMLPSLMCGHATLVDVRDRCMQGQVYQEGVCRDRCTRRCIWRDIPVLYLPCTIPTRYCTPLYPAVHHRCTY